MSKSRSIVLLGSFGLVLIVVASWFLLLSPRMGTASDLNDQRTQAEAANEATTVAISELEQLEANIGEAKEDVDDLTARFPPSAAESELFRLVKRAAEQAGLSEDDVSDLSVGVPALGATDGSVTLPEAAAAPAADPAATDPNAAPAAGAAPVAAPATQLGSMTLDVTVSGSQNEIVRFLDALESMDRAYLVSSVTLGESETGGTASISGKMYLLPELVDPTAPVEEVPVEEAPVDPAAAVAPPAG